jgi:putative resolvase
MVPVPVVRMSSRPVLVAPDAVIAAAQCGIGLYARVSSHDQRAGLDRQVARLTAWAAQCGRAVVRVEAEAGSGMNGARSKARRLLAGPGVEGGWLRSARYRPQAVVSAGRQDAGHE